MTWLLVTALACIVLCGYCPQSWSGRNVRPRGYASCRGHTHHWSMWHQSSTRLKYMSYSVKMVMPLDDVGSACVTVLLSHLKQRFWQMEYERLVCPNDRIFRHSLSCTSVSALEAGMRTQVYPYDTLMDLDNLLLSIGNLAPWFLCHARCRPWQMTANAHKYFLSISKPDTMKITCRQCRLLVKF